MAQWAYPMLAYLDAVTQLLLVLQVGYLMYSCRQFKNGIPDVLEDFEDRDLRNRTITEEVASIMNEIADGLLADEPGNQLGVSVPFDLKSLLTNVLLSKFQIQPEHGESENREIQEINPQTENETETESD